MGFYGNITNTNKTNFVFDKIYSNRKEMDASKSTDNVFIGRYVLVDYNQIDVESRNYTRIYKHPQYNWFYTAESLEWESRARYAFDENNEKIEYYIQDNNKTIINPKRADTEYTGKFFINEPAYLINSNGDYVFYKCILSNNEYAQFEELASGANANDAYYDNFLIDKNQYGPNIGRGWDSTAWQKVYVDGEEKYVMVAELNSVVPTFGITVDSPTVKPIAPHFDADSTNTYYKLHLQPSWGFRVKQAENAEQSDTKINFSEYYWNNTSKSASITTHDYNGAIYFNQDGFDVNKHSEKEYDPKVDDYITVLPTGSSGYPYNDHGKSDNVNTKDIQELEISLPGIGHAVSTMWDLVYGAGEGQASVRERNLEIGWDNVAGLRLVKAKSDGNGFEYDIGGVNTLAGCINSVHDLMGMIIVNDTEDIKLEDALINRIYYKPNDGKYYIKNLVDDLIPITDLNYTGKISTIKDFGNNLYYFNNDNYYWEDNYQYGNNYYNLEEGVDKQINPIQLYEEPWEYNKYFYYNKNDGKYVLVVNDTEDLKHPVKDLDYYIIGDITKANAKIDHKLGLEGLCFYPSYNGEINQTYIDTLFPSTSTVVGNKVFKSGLFYEFKIKEEGEEEKIGYKPVDFSTHQHQSTTRYYYWKNYTIENSTTIDGNIVETYDFNDATSIIVNLVGFKPDVYYYQDKETGSWDNLKTINDIDSINIYYEFTVENAMEPFKVPYPFYKSHMYYYKDNKNFILAKENNRIKKTNEYYTIKEVQEISKEIVFYEPNKYYYKNENGEYILDTSDTMRDGVEYYYNIIDKYVIKDMNNIYSKGQKWNNFVKVPEDNSVSLGYRKDSYEWKELEGFARTLNTIHGLILSINNLIKFGDTTTRNNKTVQGCINQMNDIINTIDKLKPNHFIAVDEYGRMTSMIPETDNWVNVQINDQETNLNNKNKIIITHKYPHAGIVDTTSISDMNKNENKNKQDTIELETLEYDDTGHVKKINTETVTLPFGYKTFQDSEETPGETVAENTQDVLTFSGDSWIKPTITQGKIEYSHIGPVKTSETKAEDADKTPQFGETFTIEDWYFDNKGHKSNHLTHTVTIPKGSLTDTEKSGSDVITQLSFDEPTGALSTTRENLSSIKLDGYSKGTDNKDIANTDTLGGALSKLQNQLNILNGSNTTSGSVAYQIAQIVAGADTKFDTLKEIADWIISDTGGVATINSNIANNTKDIEDLESLVGDTAVATQIANAINNALLIEGVNKYALATDLINLSNSVDDINNRVEDLELIITSEKIDQWNAAQANVQSDWAETNETADSYIKNKPSLDFVSMETYRDLLERIDALEARIEALENPTTEEPTPEPEIPEEPVE